MASASGLSMGGDNTETLILWQVLKNGGDMATQANMMPLLMTQLFDDNDSVMKDSGSGGDEDIQQMLLMNAFSNPDMQQWLPFVLFSEKNMQDKLLMMQYLQMMEGQGMSGMSEVFPIMLMNDDRYCSIDDGTGTNAICNCESSRSDTILKIMLLTGGSFLGNSPQQNLFFLLFNNDDSCDCKFETGGSGYCTAVASEGIDPLMMYFMMNAIPQPLQQLPQAVPRSGSVDMKQLMLSQMANL